MARTIGSGNRPYDVRKNELLAQLADLEAKRIASEDPLLGAVYSLARRVNVLVDEAVKRQTNGDIPEPLQPLIADIMAFRHRSAELLAGSDLGICWPSFEEAELNTEATIEE